jgi:protein-L-isoaspartate O-methyltransferase
LFNQLKPGGKMCIPVGPPNERQKVLLVEKDENGAGRAQTLMLTMCEPMLREWTNSPVDLKMK